MKQFFRVACIAIILLSAIIAKAQKPKAAASKPKMAVTAVVKKSIPEKEPPITDTLAYNIQNTINKLALFVLDPSKPVSLLTESFITRGTFGQPEYTSLIRFPGAVDNRIVRMHVDRQKATVLWRWCSTLVRTDKNEMPPETLTGLKERIDGIVKNIRFASTNEQNSIGDIYGYCKINLTYEKYDVVELNVQFVKPLIQTEEQSIDSVKKLYIEGFTHIETAEDAGMKFSEALLSEGLSKEKAGDIVATEIKKAADNDIKIAYQMLMGAVDQIDNKYLIAKLSDAQQTRIRTIAQAYVDAYRDQKPFDIKTFDPNPPKPAVVLYDFSKPGSATNPNLYRPVEREGKRVKCPVCNGSGQMELVDYSHTYDGIFSTVKTQVTHWATCTYCGGGGWVTKYKK